MPDTRSDPAIFQEFREALGTRDPKTIAAYLATGKLRECSTIFEVKSRKSARMFGTGGRSQPESAREAGCCTHLL
ncbi:hypothetical protein KSD_55250 [Ktedonobacter sp. SOSP1-85]|uniref:hypothetical protein n=1 Tax=Ktedonobacter sp. SOSP1-85 TaxID=2778367 RepID=UPI00191524DC|nr:hypothetical protein [Ktedonobacter sp. SOSP1-85]GHO77754.1 hypothetical protein KSD_55250 [Ktedonobacter sp. SOSP1-85]